jgi:hypothetical protein
MTDDEARAMATRFIDTWPTGPKAYVWRDILQDLDHQTATHTYRTLTRDSKHAPTPGHFHDVYRAHQRALTPPDTTNPAAYERRNAISLDTYLAGVQAHADTGNQDSIDELERWLRFGRKWSR